MGARDRSSTIIRIGVVLALLGVVAPGIVLLANDASVGGAASSLRLLKESRVSMVSEDIRFVQKTRGTSDWIVYASYVFMNRSDDSVDLRMGFPERGFCDGEYEWGDSFDPSFRNLQVRVNGRDAQVDTGSLDADEAGVCYGAIYLFDVHFEPDQRVEVFHTYEYTGTASVEGWHIEYITETGALWNGPIESARFTVAAFDVPRWIYWPKELTLSERYVDQLPTDPAGQVRTVVSFEQKEWTPDDDVEILLSPHEYDIVPECCPSLWEVRNTWGKVNRNVELERLISCVPDSSLRICRNIVYARYGRPFDDRKLAAQFYDTARLADGWMGEEGYMVVGYMENPRYGDHLLNPMDWWFVQAVLKRERRQASTGE